MREEIEEDFVWTILALLASESPMCYNVGKNFKVKNAWLKKTHPQK